MSTLKIIEHQNMRNKKSEKSWGGLDEFYVRQIL